VLTVWNPQSPARHRAQAHACGTLRKIGAGAGMGWSVGHTQGPDRNSQYALRHANANPELPSGQVRPSGHRWGSDHLPCFYESAADRVCLIEKDTGVYQTAEHEHYRSGRRDRQVLIRLIE
jgi:hypothetical protein